MSAGFIGHLHGLFRSAVRMNPGIVSADRHDSQIDGTGSAQLRKRIAERGVAAEKDATVISFENVAVVTAIGVAPRPRAPMFYAERCRAAGLASGLILSRMRSALAPAEPVRRILDKDLGRLADNVRRARNGEI
jgi:hypothetical protein